MCANFSRVYPGIRKKESFAITWVRRLQKRVPYFMRWDLAFCKDDRRCWIPDVQAFLRYVDGKAAEGACLL